MWIMSFRTATDPPQAPELDHAAPPPPASERAGAARAAGDPARSPRADGTKAKRAERTSSLDLEALPIAAWQARQHAAVALDAWRLGQETIQAAALMLSEMVTNAVRAAEPPDGSDDAAWVTVTLRLLPGRLVIEVADDDPRPPVLDRPGLDAESGRGLVIIDALAQQWGFRHAPDGGKVTFAILTVPAAGESR